MVDSWHQGGGSHQYLDSDFGFEAPRDLDIMYIYLYYVHTYVHTYTYYTYVDAYQYGAIHTAIQYLLAMYVPY